MAEGKNGEGQDNAAASAHLGILMLCHTALHRAEDVARFWAAAGCPVVIHVDKSVPDRSFNAFRQALRHLPGVRFSRRYRCEWGMWSLVAAMQSAAEEMLEAFPDVGHVYAISGSCLPLRPAAELIAMLATQTGTDYIESVTTADTPWTVGGLSDERFSLYFPFSWQRTRWLFDSFVTLQRRWKVARKMPAPLTPHLGSQWWCLTRKTLSAILNDPQRAEYDAYFRRVWIPDESYFQTLARKHATRIESRSLTLSKFDYLGKPHVFYDDHLQLLRRSDCFMARKIWPRADRLYAYFLSDQPGSAVRADPQPGKINRHFTRATEQRQMGRPGLYMQSRLPREHWERGKTAAPYSVFTGFDEVFEGFPGWLAQATGLRVHGHLFAPEKAHFAGDAPVYNGGLSQSAALRDYNQQQFLASLIWATRGERQCFQYAARDNHTAPLNWFMASDQNAHISVITGAWALPLFRGTQPAADIRSHAAWLQKREAAHLEILRSNWARARVRIWTMAEFLEAPYDALDSVLVEFASQIQTRPLTPPKLRPLAGFGAFVEELRDAGLPPFLLGDYPVSHDPSPAPTSTYFLK
ncbi:DUF5927 domain-containing protein [Roseicitreum antarcticum]